MLIHPQTIVIALFQIVTLRREALADIISGARQHTQQRRQQTTMDERLSLYKKQGPDETRPV